MAKRGWTGKLWGRLAAIAMLPALPAIGLTASARGQVPVGIQPARQAAVSSTLDFSGAGAETPSDSSESDGDGGIATSAASTVAIVSGDAIAAVPKDWWSQGSASPVAVAIGGAEGTRRPDGGKNPAYYWHFDPGNGANNFGTFSWQHLSPKQMAPIVRAGSTAQKRERSAQLGLAEVADRDAFARIEQFHDRLRAQAAEKNMTLSMRELINGLDLANQAPLAALSPMGYLDRLAQMRDKFPDAETQLLEARVWSFWHPRFDRWDAPGLGNTYATIRRDQARRIAAIDAAIAQYFQSDFQSDVRVASEPSFEPSPEPSSKPTAKPASEPSPVEVSPSPEPIASSPSAPSLDFASAPPPSAAPKAGLEIE
ncbi:MAG: hypothetical protein ACFB9N_15190 [Geitlerinemataceae cyanobacterium]